MLFENREPMDGYALRLPRFRQRLQGAPAAGITRAALSLGRARYHAGPNAHVGVSREEREWAHPDARARGRHLYRRIKRHSLVSRRRHRIRSARPARARTDAAMDVLRTVQSRAFCRHAALHRQTFAGGLAKAGGITETPGARACGPGRDGIASRNPPLFDRRAPHDCRYCALRLYARGSRSQAGSHTLFERSRVARACRTAPQAHSDYVSAILTAPALRNRPLMVCDMSSMVWGLTMTSSAPMARPASTSLGLT